MPTLRLGALEVEFVNTSRFTFAEWLFAKARTGLRPAAFETAANELDPEAWIVMALVSARRVVPDFDEAALQGLNLIELVTGLGADSSDAEAAGPPPMPAAPGPNGAASEEAESRSSETTRVPSGIPTSPSRLA